MQEGEIKNKKVTIEDLRKTVQGGFSRVDKQIEDLARAVQGGFSDVDKRFDEGFSGVYKRFDAMDKRFDRLEERVLSLELRLASVEGILNEHTDILARHSEELRWLHQKIDDMTNPQSPTRVATHQELAEIEKRVSILEQKLTEKNITLK